MYHSQVGAIIRDWPPPRKVERLQSFLRFANFYRRLVPSYSDMLAPLTQLTCKGAPRDWSLACQEAFRLLKDAFSSAPVLHHFDPSLPPIVETDASACAIAAILSLRTDDGEIHPVAFYSRPLHGAELNYNTHDKELLATFEAFQNWHHYLESPIQTINIVTNHKDLEYLATMKILTRRQAHWSDYLSAFNLAVRFRPVKLSKKLDSPTRRVDYYLKREGRDGIPASPQNLRPVSEQQLASSLRATRLQEISRDTVSLVDISSPILGAASLMEDIKADLQVDPLSKRELDQCLRGALSPRSSLSPLGLPILDHVPDYGPEEGNLHTRILQVKHDQLTAGHFGCVRTLQHLRRDYFWPSIRTSCKNFVMPRALYARNKPSLHRLYSLPQPLPIPGRPWHFISMDLIERLPASDRYTAIPVVINRLSKEDVFIPTTDTATSTATEAADAFVPHIFTKHGVPLQISSDRGVEFTSHLFRSLSTLLQTRLHFTSGYHPSANEQVERTSSPLERYLRIYHVYEQEDWPKLLSSAEFAYNDAPHSSTGLSPFFAMKGYDPLIAVHPVELLPSLCPSARTCQPDNSSRL